MNEVNENRFAGLWSCLATAWATTGMKDQAKREILELLCGALWHLQRASQLGAISPEPLATFHCVAGEPRWQIWTREGQWSDLYRGSLLPTIQSMLIADAALCLEGAISVLREIPCIKGNMHVRMVLPYREEIEKWLATSKFPGTMPDILRQVTVIVAFRDRYLHGEVAGKDYRKAHQAFTEFRERELLRYSLVDVEKICLEILCRLSMIASDLQDANKTKQTLKNISLTQLQRSG